ncbi:MAG: O-antigen ligase family protein, partial [Cyanobacteria bacterium J06554_3]
VFSVLLALQPLYAGGLVVAIAGTYVFIRHFEQAVLGILLMRSVLDMYSAQQIPALFAIGVDGLVFLYLGRQWILRRQVHTDPFWWFLFGWVMVQSTWVLLLAANGLGGTPDMAFEAMREWTRFFSLAMVYLLVMQLRDRISPARLATFLLLAAAIPLALALLQALPIDLPGFLQSNVTWTAYESEGSRINSTLGHYNSFATFSLLFMALALWRAQIARKPWGWLLLGAGLLYCLLLSKSLTGIVMLIVFCAVYFLPRLRGKGLLGAIAITIAIAFLLSTDLAQSRLLELNQTPLLNPDLSISRAMALQAADMDEFRNSFNWRLLQWRNLLMDWQQHPLLGYGMASAKRLSVFDTTSHNDYIRFLVEEGIVGLSLFLLFLMAQVARLVQIMRQSLPDSPQRALSQIMFAFLISMVVGMAAGNVMVHTATFFYWWALMAILGWSWQPRSANMPAPSPAAELAFASFSSEFSATEPFASSAFIPPEAGSQAAMSSARELPQVTVQQGVARYNLDLPLSRFSRSPFDDMGADDTGDEGLATEANTSNYSDSSSSYSDSYVYTPADTYLLGYDPSNLAGVDADLDENE